MTDPLTDEPSRVSARRATRHQWGLRVLGVSLSALALAILISATALSAADLATGTLIADVAVLAAMATGVVVGFVYGAPRGILRFRSRDLLYGVVIGLALRLVQGLVAQAAQGGAAAWPTATLDLQWVVFGALVPVVVSPLLEELFFRGVLLISADTVFRRLTGSRVLAGIAATLVSSALFVLAHGLMSTLDVSAIVSLGAVALVTSTIVLVQRRLWTAIVVHAVFNVTFVIFQLAGSLGTAGAPSLS